MVDRGTRLAIRPKARLPCVQIPMVERAKVCTVSGILWGGDFRLDPAGPLPRPKGAAMPDYSIVILICSTALSHSDCQPDTALDVVRGPQVNNPVLCALDAQ